jgi:hypothetical protein
MNNQVKQRVKKRTTLLINQPETSDGHELIPAEVSARIEREGENFADSPNNSATRSNKEFSTVDQEGLVNNYPITPEPYLQSEQRFGFTPRAEKLNGRLAMVGFIALIVTELVTQSSLVKVLGIF